MWKFGFVQIRAVMSVRQLKQHSIFTENYKLVKTEQKQVMT